MEFKVLQTFQFEDKLLVVYDPNGPMRNLYAYDAEGERLWIAENRMPQDAYTSVAANGKILLATTWEYFCCMLDPATGKVISSAWTR